MKSLLQECSDVIDEVSEKFGYESEDVAGNDSLKTVLKRIAPIMLRDSTPEGRQLFFDMLRHTPIVIAGDLTEEEYKKMKLKYLGNPNPHIKEEKAELGEYDRNTVPDGAYISEPIISPDMKHILGKKSFLFFRKVEGREKNFFGTDINVSHLIHELGHAWHSELNEYTITEDGKLVNRVGTAELVHSFEKNDDGTYTQNLESSIGLMIEEAMNTVEEEDVLAKYKGLSHEQMKNAYTDVLVPSCYQGYMADFMRYLLEELGKDDFEAWRLTGSKDIKAKIEALFARTEFWQKREQDILPDSGSKRAYNIKQDVISRICSDSEKLDSGFGMEFKRDSAKLKEFFEKYQDVFFPDISKMSPLEKIDNVLLQRFNLESVKYVIGIDNYRDFIISISEECYPLINQAIKIKQKDEQSKNFDLR